MAIVCARAMRSGCTSASARACPARRWIALAVALLAWGAGAGAAPRSFPCNESWVVRPNVEVQVDLRVPRESAAREQCGAACEWRVATAEDWAWLSLRFTQPNGSHVVDFGPEGESADDGSRASEGGVVTELELEVRWPRPDGAWLSTRLRDASLNTVSSMRVPASRAVLGLRNPACASEPARVRRMAVGVAAHAQGATAAASASAVLHLVPPPSALQLFGAVLAACFGVACVVLLASCLCCNWGRRLELTETPSSSPSPSPQAPPAPPRRAPRRRHRSVGHTCLVRAFHNFMRESRRSLELEDLRPGPFKWPRRSRSYHVAWSSQDAEGAVHILAAAATAATATASAPSSARPTPQSPEVWWTPRSSWALSRSSSSNSSLLTCISECQNEAPRPAPPTTPTPSPPPLYQPPGD